MTRLTANLKLQYRRLNIPSRALNTVYQNTTGSPLFVMVTYTYDTTTTAQAKTDSSNPPTTVVTSISNSLANITGGTSLVATDMTFVVQPNDFYTVSNAGGAGTVIWTEWT